MLTTINATSARTAKFGSGGIILRAKPGTYLDNDHVASLCPSVFARSRHESRSERYSYIPTRRLLGGLKKEGFLPVEVKQGGSRDELKRGFTKHLIRFRRKKDLSINVGDSVPEVILLNSHDGTSSYQLMLGMFRLVCSNGLIVGDGNIQGIKVNHRGDVMDQVIDAAYTVIDESKQVLPLIEDMRAIELNPAEQTAFGTAAAALRFDEEAQIRPEQVLRPHRSADLGDDLWRVFNRTQENLLRGGILGRSVSANGHTQLRRSRQVHGIDQDVRLNRALWTLADEMRKIKTAA